MYVPMRPTALAQATARMLHLRLRRHQALQFPCQPYLAAFLLAHQLATFKFLGTQQIGLTHISFALTKLQE